MERRERRVAQIVRDFLEAYCLSEEVGARLRDGELDFAAVDRLVGEHEESALFRLKEECHALFRFDENRTPEELQAEELFDLAVGALFHEAMKFREGYYLTTAYGPRLERIAAEGSSSATLLGAFSRVFEAGRRRMREAQAETQALFRETRDQMLLLLRQFPRGGAVARSLLADALRSERVFAMPLEELLADIYGAARAGYEVAVESLVESGHYLEAAEIMERGDASGNGCCAGGSRFARGMARYYAGDLAAALEHLEGWIASGANGSGLWRERASSALWSISGGAVRSSSLAGRARKALVALTVEKE